MAPVLALLTPQQPLLHAETQLFGSFLIHFVVRPVLDHVVRIDHRDGLEAHAATWKSARAVGTESINQVRSIIARFVLLELVCRDHEFGPEGLDFHRDCQRFVAQGTLGLVFIRCRAEAILQDYVLGPCLFHVFVDVNLRLSFLDAVTLRQGAELWLAMEPRGVASHGSGGSTAVDTDQVWERSVQTVPSYIKTRSCVPHLDRVEKVAVGLNKSPQMSFSSFVETLLRLTRLVEQFAHRVGLCEQVLA